MLIGIGLGKSSKAADEAMADVPAWPQGLGSSQASTSVAANESQGAGSDVDSENPVGMITS